MFHADVFEPLHRPFDEKGAISIAKGFGVVFSWGGAAGHWFVKAFLFAGR